MIARLNAAKEKEKKSSNQQSTNDGDQINNRMMDQNSASQHFARR
jgi:hypothetical protein